MRTLMRSGAVLGLLTTAILAATSSRADAAFSYSIAADNGTQTTTYVGFFTPAPTNLGPMYAAFGSPVVTNQNGFVTYNFNASISPNFKAQAGGFVLGQETDGHLVLNIHFDTPVSISANIWEGGVFSTTSPGSVSVTGGELVIEAVNPSPVESHSNALTAAYDGLGGWTATASTVPFVGTYTDYQISIDNNLTAQAFSGSQPAGSAAIFKKDFILQIVTGGGGQPPTPEPASLGILGVGAAGLMLRRRR